MGHGDGASIALIHAATQPAGARPSRSRRTCSSRRCASRRSARPSAPTRRTGCARHGPPPSRSRRRLLRVERRLAPSWLPRLGHHRRLGSHQVSAADHPGRGRPVRDDGAARRDRGRRVRDGRAPAAAGPPRATSRGAGGDADRYGELHPWSATAFPTSLSADERPAPPPHRGPARGALDAADGARRVRAVLRGRCVAGDAHRARSRASTTRRRRPGRRWRGASAAAGCAPSAMAAARACPSRTRRARCSPAAQGGSTASASRARGAAAGCSSSCASPSSVATCGISSARSWPGQASGRSVTGSGSHRMSTGRPRRAHRE